MKTDDSKLFDMKGYAPKPTSIESQRLAMDFANEVAMARLNQIRDILGQVKESNLLPVDALLQIRALSGRTH